MSEYIPKDKVLELWWYWKFIEAYDQTKEMKGIELDDYVPREWHDRVCEEMAKRHTADGYKMLDDGTLVVSVDDATKVTRVLVEDSEKNGDLYYADRPKGEWIDRTYGGRILHPWWESCECSQCEAWGSGAWNFCPECGADMRGEDNETD